MDRYKWLDRSRWTIEEWPVELGNHSRNLVMSQTPHAPWWTIPAFIAFIVSILIGIVREDQLWFGIAMIFGIPIGVSILRVNLRQIDAGTNPPNSLSKPELRMQVMWFSGVSAVVFGLFAACGLFRAWPANDTVIAIGMACAMLVAFCFAIFWKTEPPDYPHDTI